jgi:hypothetical protein
LEPKIRYIADFEFFLFAVEVFDIEKVVAKFVDENVLKLPPKELSILSEFVKISEIPEIS